MKTDGVAVRFSLVALDASIASVVPSQIPISDLHDSPSAATSSQFLQRRQPRNDDVASTEYRLLPLRAYNNRQRRAAFAERGIPLMMVQKLEEQNMQLQQIASIRAKNATVRRQEVHIGQAPSVHSPSQFSEESGAALAVQAEASDVSSVISSQREQLVLPLMVRAGASREGHPFISTLLGSGLTTRTAEELIAILRQQNVQLRQQASVAPGVFPRAHLAGQNASDSEASRSASSDVSSGIFGSSSKEQQFSCFSYR